MGNTSTQNGGAGGINIQAGQQLGSMVGPNGGGSLGFQYLMAENDEQRGELLANSSILSEEEFEQVSDTVRRVRKQAATLVDDLRSRGLTKGLSLSVYNDTWPTVSTFDGADVGMHPSDTSEEQGVTFGDDGAPLPVISADWHIDNRQLMVSRATNADISTLVPAEMTRNVVRTFEGLCINGWSRPVDGYEMYGFRNHPDRNQVTAPGSWSDNTNDSTNIRDTFLDVIEALENDEYDGGNYQFYLNRTQFQRLRRVVDDIGQGEVAMMERIREEFSEDIGSLNQNPFIPAGEMVAFEPTDDVLNLGVAENVQPVQWDHPSGFKTNWKIFAALNLELFSNQAGQTGFAHVTGM